MFKKALLASVAAATMFVATNADAAVYIRVIENGVTIFNSSSATGMLTYTGASANFTISNATVTGAPMLAQPQLVSTSFQLTSVSPTTLTILFSQDALTANAGGAMAFTATDTFNGLLGAGTGTSRSYIGVNAFDMTTLIGSANANVLGSQTTNTNVTLPAPSYSETIRYDFTFTGAGNVVNANTQIAAAAVPEAATWAMMLVGFGGIGGALRAGRRQRVSFMA